MFDSLRKKLKGKISYLVLIIIVLLQVPVLLNNLRFEGRELTPTLYPGIGQPQVLFPPQDSNAIAIFWASWCGPCKIEMNRFRNSVNKGKIPADKIFAINPFEDRGTIEKFLKENQYPFVFIEAPAIAADLQINRTPTTVFVKKGKVTRMSTGMSFIGIWLAEWQF